MREIAPEASQDTLSVSARAQLDTEISALYEDYRKIIQNTVWNGRSLLDGSQSTLEIQAGPNRNDRMDFSLPNIQPTNVFTRTFGSGSWTSSTVSMPNIPLVDDFNGDGIDDVLGITASSDVLTVRLGNGDGTFGAQITSTVGVSAAAAPTPDTISTGDLNGDGISDLAYQTSSNQAVIAYGSESGTFTFGQTIAMTTGVSSLKIGDLDADGDLDLQLSDASAGQATSLLNNGNGTLASRSTSSILSTSKSPTLADLNNDGIADLAYGVLGIKRLFYHLGNGDGSFGSVQSFTTDSIGSLDSVSYVAVGDFNADGLADLGIFATDSAGAANAMLLTYLGESNGAFTLSSTHALSLPFSSQIRAVDYDNDGDDDLLLRSRTAYDFFESDGNGQFRNLPSEPLSGNRFFDVGDFNGDGAVDLFHFSAAYLQNTEEREATSDVRVSTAAEATQLLDILENAITGLQAAQSKVTSFHSRLETSMSAALILSENLTEARSSTLDADLALEIAELTRHQVLQQAQVAVATQANLQLSLVMRLLEPLQNG